jgi:hypothetical protein
VTNTGKMLNKNIEFVGTNKDNKSTSNRGQYATHIHKNITQ